MGGNCIAGYPTVQCVKESRIMIIILLLARSRASNTLGKIKPLLSSLFSAELRLSGSNSPKGKANNNCDLSTLSSVHNTCYACRP